MNDLECYTPERAAEILHIGRSTIYRMLRLGDIRSTRIGPTDKLYRISGAEIARLLGREGDER